MRVSGDSIRREGLKNESSRTGATNGGWRSVRAWAGRVGFVLLILTFFSVAEAGVIRVKAGTATGAHDGSSWPNAYADLQAALTAAQPYDEIWVAAGTYKPTTDTDRTKSFVMKPAVALYGGFSGTEVTSDTRNWTANVAILSGDIGASGDISDNSYHVVTGKFQGVLDGFTITGGNANGSWSSPNANGGGMINDSVSPTIANCTFTGNTAMGGYGKSIGSGGGMYNTNASPTVTNCTFTSNTSNYRGGGICCENYSSPTVTYCAFTGNLSGLHDTGFGGGIGGDGTVRPMAVNCTFMSNSAVGDGYGGGTCWVNATNCTFMGNTAYGGGGMSSGNATNCTFTNNTAKGSGGGMYEGDATNCAFTGNTTQGGGGGLVLGAATNCTFTNNKACLNGINGGGGGMELDGFDVTNCTFTNNAAGGHGGGALLVFGINEPDLITNCIFWNDGAPQEAEIYKLSGSPTYQNCDIQGCGGSGGLHWDSSLGTDGGGNLDVDPHFVNAANPAGPDGIWRTADDGLALTSGSLCIDAGLASAAPLTDILGNPRVGPPDIGAYEFQGTTPIPTPVPITAPQGRLAITYTITTPSTGPVGQAIQYTYHWTSDGGDDVTHGPTTALSDTLNEMDKVQPGETWTLTVTPSAGNQVGPAATAKVMIQSPKNGVAVWTYYP